MKVFISWSQDRSKAVAKALNSWLGQVIQAVEPWMSSDIDKGARWISEVAEKLEVTKMGIICLTRENLDAPWILFEAGALSKTKGAQVCTFLLDVQPANVELPLGQFQHTTIEKQDVRELVKTINKSVAQNNERALTDDVLERVFERSWPELTSELERITRMPIAEAPPQRPEREILMEILDAIRNQERQHAEREDTLLRTLEAVVLRSTPLSLADYARGFGGKQKGLRDAIVRPGMASTDDETQERSSDLGIE